MTALLCVVTMAAGTLTILSWILDAAWLISINTHLRPPHSASNISGAGRSGPQSRREAEHVDQGNLDISTSILDLQTKVREDFTITEKSPPSCRALIFAM